MIDLHRLAAIPSAVLARPAAVQRGIADSIAYLGSDEARRSLALDPYWPKWHSPWWHMLLLEELGEARAIPSSTVAALIASMDSQLHFFPVRPEELPGADPELEIFIFCHCALGNIARLLTACGVELERSLPWVRPWFRRYQMADGGLNCDGSAYLATGECPSSMVATIAPLEALLAQRALGQRRQPERRHQVTSAELGQHARVDLVGLARQRRDIADLARVRDLHLPAGRRQPIAHPNRAAQHLHARPEFGAKPQNEPGKPVLVRRHDPLADGRAALAECTPRRPSIRPIDPDILHRRASLRGLNYRPTLSLLGGPPS